MVDQRLDFRQLRALAGVGDGLALGPAGAGQPFPQVVEVGLRHGEIEFSIDRS